MRKHLSLIGFSLALLLPAAALAAQVQVSVGMNSISPSTIHVNTGDTVVWTNTSSGIQSVTGDDGSFQSGSIAPGGQFATTFNSGGTYNYYDNADGSAILGEVIVSGSSIVSTPAPTVTSTTYVNPNTNYVPTAPASVSSSPSALLAWLTSEVQSLLAQINALTGGLGTATGSSSSSSSTGVSGSSTSGIVSGFLQVMPVSGAAPLSTTITATVNTAASCSGASYTLDFGDGTQEAVIPVAAGDCSQQNQSFQHTYQYGGTYTITLSSGTHSSTATVTVSGAAAPSTASTASTAANATQATGSISAPITSGPAPFSATLYVSCASGLAYDVVFGDGTDIGSSGVSQSGCSGGLQAISHTYNLPGTYTAQLVIFIRNTAGTVSSENVGQQSMTATTPSSTQ